MRLPNGYGNIVNLGKGRRKPLGVRVPIGVKVTEDKREIPQYKYIGYFENTPQGKKEALQLLSDYNAGKSVLKYSSSCPTFKEVADEWLSRHFKHLEATKGGYSSSLVYSYTAAIKKFKSIYNMRMDCVKLQTVQDIIDNLSDLSSQTNQNVGIVIKGILKLAKKQGFIEENFYDDIEFFGKTNQDSIHIDFTEEEVNKLWEHQDEEYAQFILVMIYTGVRIVELMNIKVEDIDYDNKYVIGGSKTKAGKGRIIPFADKIFPFIEKRKNNTYLFEYKHKKLNYTTACSHLWEPAMEQYGMNHLPHDTRYTCATMLDRAKVPQHITKTILGHRQSDVTNAVYIKKNVDDLLSEINKI